MQYLIFALLLLPDDSQAASVYNIANQLVNIAIKLGTAVGTLGIIWGGMQLVFGNPQGGRNLTYSVFGFVVVGAAMAIQKLLMSVV
jgi:hypothetical protein